MNTPADFSLFRNYSLALKAWLEKNCYVSNLPQENNIEVIYSSVNRAWVNRVMQIANGQNTNGNINIILSSYEYLENENILGFVTETKPVDNTKVDIVKPPLVYSLTYKLTIFTRLQSEMDILIYQILTKAHKHAKAVMVVDGQWAEIVAGNPTPETNLETVDIQDRIVRTGIEMRVKRAYLPTGYYEEDRINE